MTLWRTNLRLIRQPVKLVVRPEIDLLEQAAVSQVDLDDDVVDGR